MTTNFGKIFHVEVGCDLLNWGLTLELDLNPGQRALMLGVGPLFIRVEPVAE